MTIEILPYEVAVKYLGRKVSFCEPHRTEVDNRIACAWRRFGSVRTELTSKNFSLSSRLRLFDMTVGATFLYGAATWTLTKELEIKIRGTQRKMLRMMLGSNRRVIGRDDHGAILEPWPDWIQRTTRQAEDHMRHLQLRDWVRAHESAKQKWLLSITESGGDNWTYWALHWSPGGTRRPGRPRKRWTDGPTNE